LTHTINGTEGMSGAIVNKKYLYNILLVLAAVALFFFMIKVMSLLNEYSVPKNWAKFIYYSVFYFAGATYCSILSLKGKKKSVPLYLLLFGVEILVVTFSFLIFYFNFLPLPEKRPEQWTIAIIFLMGFTVVAINYLSEKLLKAE
jgi:hypothetical protein